jgi:hypothetical protein
MERTVTVWLGSLGTSRRGRAWYGKARRGLARKDLDMSKVFVLHGDSSMVSGHIMKLFATRELANVEAAKLANILLDEQEMNQKATPDNWSDCIIEMKQAVADDRGCDLDDLGDDECGDLWIIEEELIGATEPIEVSVLPMALSDGTTDYYSHIKCGDRSMSIYKHKIAGRSEYEAAEFRWLFGQGEKPDILAFETEAPAHA